MDNTYPIHSPHWWKREAELIAGSKWPALKTVFEDVARSDNAKGFDANTAAQMGFNAVNVAITAPSVNVASSPQQTSKKSKGKQLQESLYGG